VNDKMLHRSFLVVGYDLDKIMDEFVIVKLINSESALDSDGHFDSFGHFFHTLKYKLRLFHETCPKGSFLDSGTGTSNV
jgi:hypothetical protein